MYAVPPMPETSGITETIISRWMKAENGRENLFQGQKVVGEDADFLGYEEENHDLMKRIFEW